jgi:Arc/MetJ family transcription regulator
MSRNGWVALRFVISCVYTVSLIHIGFEMRTNIEIDDELMTEVMEFMGTKSKRETVEQLLRDRLQIKRQSGMRKWMGKIDWQGDLDSWRRD